VAVAAEPDIQWKAAIDLGFAPDVVAPAPSYGADKALRQKEFDMPKTLERQTTNGAVQAPPPRPPARTSNDNGGYWAAFALLLGFLVVVLGTVAVWMGVSAHDARHDANQAVKAVGSGAAMPGMTMSGGNDLASFAGQGPANADVLAKKHVPMNAALPPAPAGPVARVHLVLVDKTLEIAPGVKYAAWAFSDHPGLYPFVSHSFASVDLGQVGLLNVGNVAGTMSH
jgi:hypothetical protein